MLSARRIIRLNRSRRGPEPFGRESTNWLVSAVELNATVLFLVLWALWIKLQQVREHYECFEVPYGIARLGSSVSRFSSFLTVVLQFACEIPCQGLDAQLQATQQRRSTK